MGNWLNARIDTDSSKFPSTLPTEAVCLRFIPQPKSPNAFDDLWYYCRVREFEELKCGQDEYGPVAINRSLTKSRYSWSSLRKWTDLTEILKQPYLHGCETFVRPNRSNYLWVMNEKLTALRVDQKYREFQEAQFAANSSQLEQCLCNVHCSYAVPCNFTVDTVHEEIHLKDNHNSSLFIIVLITAICVLFLITLIYLSGKEAPINPISRQNSVIFVREYVNK